MEKTCCSDAALVAASLASYTTWELESSPQNELKWATGEGRGARGGGWHVQLWSSLLLKRVTWKLGTGGMGWKGGTVAEHHDERWDTLSRAAALAFSASRSNAACTVNTASKEKKRASLSHQGEKLKAYG